MRRAVVLLVWVAGVGAFPAVWSQTTRPTEAERASATIEYAGNEAARRLYQILAEACRLPWHRSDGSTCGPLVSESATSTHHLRLHAVRCEGTESELTCTTADGLYEHQEARQLLMVAELLRGVDWRLVQWYESGPERRLAAPQLSCEHTVEPIGDDDEAALENPRYFRCHVAYEVSGPPAASGEAAPVP